MNFRKLAVQAKKVVDQRGGTDALKGDLGELQKIAKGTGSASDKAKAAAAALRDPGRRRAGTPQPEPEPAPPEAPPAG